MASGEMVYGNSNVTHMLQNDGFPSSHESLDSLLFSGTSPTFHGSRSMVNFADAHGVSMPESSFFRPFDQEENYDEDFDEYLRQPEKKRRLTVDQVQFLEKSFEVENKLEPDRKVQLAKDLGLQPRQVAIWFQNRRARWKTKQLEKDYDALRASYNTLKTNYERMLKEKEKLKTEVLSLTNQHSLKEKEKEISSELSLTNQQSQKEKEKEKEKEIISSELPNPNSVISEDEKPPLNAASMVFCKQEDLGSANSDVVDSSSSPCYNDGVQSSLLVVEPASSSHAFEIDQHSELSQDDQEDNFSQSLQVPSSIYNFPKFEDSVYTTNPHANSCNYEFLAEEQPGWFWPY